MTKGYKIGDEVVSKSTGRTYKISNKKNGGYFLETADGYIFATKYQCLKKYFDKVTQNVTNSNTKDLTEQLHQGKLPDNHHYYFQMPNGKYEVGNTFCLETLRWCKDGDKIKVLEEIPSYEKLQEKESQRISLMTRLNDVNNNNHALEIENTKLKELLMSARNYLKSYRDLYSKDNEDVADFIKEIDQVLVNNQIQTNTVACNKIQENE